MQRPVTVETVLGSALAASGALTISYPAGFNENHFAVRGAKIAVKNGGLLTQPENFTVVFNPTSAVVTMNSDEPTIPAGTTLFVEFRQKGNASDVDLATINPTGNRISRRQVVEINLGAPATIDDDGICASQNRTGAGALLINGALASGGVCVLDVPRNVIADSGGADTAVITITGTDEYGAVMKENITLNGTTGVSGKKAFKTITAVASSATITNGFFLGTGDVLGLPVFLPNSAYVLYDLEDSAAVTDGTYVAGLTTDSTATSADVRGTYDPNSACNGDKNFSIVLLLENPEYLGPSQYAG